MDKLLRNVCALILTTAMMLGIMQGPLTWAFANGSSTTNNSMDLATSGWINAVTLETKANNQWTPTTTVHDGDEAQITMSFKIPSGNSLNKGSVLTYQLPQGVVINSRQSGKVYVNDSDEDIGDYAIDTNGRLTITLNSKFVTGKSYNVDIGLSGVIKKSQYGSQGQNDEIDFAGSNTKIKFDDGNTTSGGGQSGGGGQAGHDMNLNKTQKLSDDHKTMNYTISVTTNNGTGSEVDLHDYFTNIVNANPSYIQDSFVLKRNGQTISFDKSKLKFVTHKSWDNKETPGFDLTGLPNLKAGENYELTYKANVGAINGTDGSVKVGNNASGQAGNVNTGERSVDQTVSDANLSKTGSLIGGEFEWKIVVNKYKYDLSKYHLSDQLPNGLELVKPIKVTYGDDENYHPNEFKFPGDIAGKKGDKSISIDFSKLSLSDDQKNKAFVIEYTTTAPKVTTETKYTNHVTLEDGNRDHQFKASGDGIDQPDSNFNKIDKYAGKAAEKAQTIEIPWTINVELSGRAIKSFAFEDTVHNAKLGDTDKGESSHYTNISEIKKALDQMNITGYDADNNYKAFQKDVDYNYTLTCFDKKDGNVVTDETKPVHYFKVEVNALRDVFRANKCTMTYNTIGDRSSMPTGTTWSFFNEGQLTKYDGDTLKPDDKTDKNSHYDYKNERLLEKQASLDNNNGSYKHDDLNANYNSLSEDTIDGKKVKILFYRLALNLSANENDPINIEDQLPEGIRYVEGSAKAYFYKDACKQNTNGNNYDLSKHDPTVTVDKNNKMSIHLDAGYGFKDPQKICIDYKVIVLDEGWKATPSDNLNTVNVQKALTNTANWKEKDGATDSQKTVVSKPIETLNKTGKQITEIVDGQVKYKK